ncbi:MAG TPA: hypothetical protein VGM56_04630 [Byssovorax sp.]|jgi:hypothetical protein
MSRRSPRLSAFASGLLAPSLASIVGAAAFALAELACACACVTPRRLAEVEPRWLMKDGLDEYARVSLEAFRMAAEAPAPLGVVYLGSSMARRALLDGDDPAPIEADLARLVGERVRFHSLETPGQTLLEARSLAALIPRSFDGVVTIVVHEDHDDERNAAVAGAKSFRDLARLAVDTPGVTPPTGVHFLDHLDWYAARRGALARLGPVPEWPRGGPPTAGGRPIGLRRWREIERRAEANPSPLLDKHELALETLVESARGDGRVVVLLESPANPRYAAFKAHLATGYRSRMQALAKRTGALYWDLNPVADLVPEEFDDQVHLGAYAARLRFQTLYVNRLAAQLVKMRDEANGR